MLLTLTILPGLAHAAEVDAVKLAGQALDRHIRPGYARLAAATGRLRHAVADVCASPSEGAVEQARTDFAATVEAFARVEHLRFGPVTEAYRDGRLFYWPDPNGIGHKQVRAALSAKDPTTLDAATLRSKSVALQGLPALDVLLNGEGSEMLAAGGEAARYRCGFASAIATNVDTIAGEVLKEWGDEGEWGKAFRDPAANTSIYQTPSEITRELFKSWTGGIKWVREQKLRRPLGESAERARPGLLPFAKSGLAFPSIAANLEGLRDLFVESGFREVVAKSSDGLDQSALFELDRGVTVLRGLKGPPSAVLRDDEQREQLNVLATAMKSLEAYTGEAIASAASITFGFNATDGD